MRSIKPLCLTAAVALALSSGAAFAQARVSTGTTAAGTSAATTTGTTSGRTTTSAGTTTSSGTPAGSVGGCSGSGGSSCTATTSNANSTTSTGTTTSNSVGSEGSVGSPATQGDTVTQTSTGRVQGQTGTTTTVDSGTSRTDPFAPGGPFAGSGTTSGASGTTSGTGTTGNTTGNTNGEVALIPGTALGAGAGTTSVNPASQQNVFVQPQGQSGSALSSTPIFDQAAREGRAKEARRRASGNEPRVIGIAPRTDRDLTHQMPDDPIIRY